MPNNPLNMLQLTPGNYNYQWRKQYGRTIEIENTIFENTNFFTAVNKVINHDEVSIADAYRINKIIKKT